MTVYVFDPSTKGLRLDALPKEAWTVLSGGRDGDTGDPYEFYKSVPWLFQAVNIRANAVSRMPLRLLNKAGDPVEEPETIFPWWRRLSDLVDGMEADRTLYGRAYLLKQRNRFGVEKPPRRLAPQTIIPDTSEEAGLIGFKRMVGSKELKLTLEEMVYSWTPSRGKVVFKGKEVTGFQPDEMARMGMGRSFQITSTFNRLTAFQNIRLAILSKRGIRFNFFRRVDKMQDITAETDAVLKRINLFQERDFPASVLSYGKHRALEISLALAGDPDLIMLDEPTAGMSRDETHTAVDLIRRLTEGKTVVIIEHDMDVVFSLADRITVLHYGQILATGTPAEIRQNQAVKDAYLGETEMES